VDAIDGWLEGILQGPNASLEIVLLISFLLGLRHASDPDHLAAVTSLIASERGLSRARKASLMVLEALNPEVPNIEISSKESSVAVIATLITVLGRTSVAHENQSY
jgi:high-affinity nickel permease